MKKSLSLVTTIATFTLIFLLASCGSAKKTSSTYPKKEEAPQRVKVEKEECEEMSYEKSDFLRGYGVGTSADKMFARDMAAASARNEILNQVQVSASNYLTRFNQQHLASGEGPGLTREDIGKAGEDIKSIAEENLKGARIICSNTYMVGQNYEVHVCIELTNEDFLGQVYNELSNDKKLHIDFEEHKFKEEMDKEMEEYRKRK